MNLETAEQVAARRQRGYVDSKGPAPESSCMGNALARGRWSHAVIVKATPGQARGMERTGIEPVTSGLQSRRSPS